MRIRTQCRECGLPFPDELTAASAEVVCPGCGHRRPVAPDGWRDGSPQGKRGRVESCPLCGSDHLYRQQDVNRAWGCGLVLLGAALAYWTYGLSLLITVALDWATARRLREAPVCYRCDTVFRDAEPSGRQGEFDLLKHDVVKYGKTWEDNRTDSARGDSAPDG